MKILNNLTITKWVKVAVAAVMTVVVALMITFGGVSTSRGRTIKTQKASIERLCRENDSLVKIVNQLGAESVITVNVAFNMTQKNILSFSQNNCQQIAKEVATMTRSELYDSLYVKKTEEKQK